MSLSLDRMIALVRRGLGDVSESELDDDDVVEYLNMALWEIESDYQFETKHAQFSTALVEGSRTYSIAEASLQNRILDSIVSIAIMDSEGQSYKLIRSTRDWYDEHYNSSSDQYGRPERYLREGTSLTLWPTPSADYAGNTLRMTFRQGVPSLVAGASASGRLPRQWDEIVVEGAIARGHFFKQDYDLTVGVENLQSRKISKTKSELEKDQRDMSRARLSVIWSEEDLR